MAEEYDPFEAAKARAKARDEKAASKHAGPKAGFEAFGGKMLSTLTGGLTDYLELARRNIGEPEDKRISIDQLRKEADELYAARSGLSTAGDIAGSVLQFTGAGKGLNLLGRGAQAIPALAGAGKALTTTMNAPGIAGGLKSGLLTGATVGTGKEAIHQADRLGSDKTAAEDFSPFGALGRIAIDTAGGGIGGGIGGQLAAMTGKGQIAQLAKSRLDDEAIKAAQGASDETLRMGLGGTAGTGKLAAHEAARAVEDPIHKAALADVASKLSGLSAEAGKRSGGQLPDEALGQAFRTSSTPGSFASRAREARADVATGENAVFKMGSKPLNPAAEWDVLGDPALKALRDRLVNEARTGAQAGGMTKAAAVTAHPSQTVDVLREMSRRAPDEAAQAKILGALDKQTATTAKGKPAPDGGEFAQLRRANEVLDDFQRVQRAMGRGHATMPPEPSSTFGASLFGGPATWTKDLAVLAKNALEGGARRRAGQMNLDDRIEELLRQIGQRTTPQKGTEATLSPLLLSIMGNMTR